MELIDVVKKLIGQTQPIGETNTDDIRFEHLIELCKLTYELISELESLRQYKTSHEFSVKRVGQFADNYLKRLKHDLE